jgi:hypothetical protein
MDSGNSGGGGGGGGSGSGSGGGSGGSSGIPSVGGSSGPHVHHALDQKTLTCARHIHARMQASHPLKKYKMAAKS